jgi:hypothetical protein
MVIHNEKIVECPNCHKSFKLEVPKEGCIFHDTCPCCNKYMAYDHTGKIVGSGDPLKNLMGIGG